MAGLSSKRRQKYCVIKKSIISWTFNKKEEIKMKISEMRTLRLMVGVTMTDRHSRKYITGSLDVTKIVRTMRENRSRWFEHVEKRNNLEYSHQKNRSEIKIEGNQ